MITGILVVTGIVALLAIAWLHERARAEALRSSLFGYIAFNGPEPVDFSSLAALPPPVSRYFRRVLPEGQHLICSAGMRQFGQLRTAPQDKRWFAFGAREDIVPAAKGFVWDARIRLPFGAHLRVLDSSIAGSASGRISLLSVFPLGTDAGTPELNAGALHRYLAEAVWCPTALLPQSGVEWTAIDEQSALATLCAGDVQVSLEFRFNAAGEVSGIYTSGRFARMSGEYKLLPWEGHFNDYQRISGILVPGHGEVGWHVDGQLEIVWKGDILDIQYDA